MVSITAKGPIVFLRLAEKQTGMYDGVIFPSSFSSDTEYYDFRDEGVYLNYTKMRGFTGDIYNVSPRLQLNDLFAYKESTGRTVSGSVGLTLMDTNREKAIALGPDYPYSPQDAGKCIIPSTLHTYNDDYFLVGDKLTINLNLSKLLQT